MPLGDWLKKLAKERHRFSAASPTPEYPAPRHAIEACLAHLRQEHPDGWVSVYTHDRKGILVARVQIAARSINMLLHELDVPSVLAQDGLAHLADRTSRIDLALFEIHEATPAELAVAVESLLRHAFAIGEFGAIEARCEE